MITPLRRAWALRIRVVTVGILLWVPMTAGAQVRINYQDADLATVVAALAEMAELNVVFIGGDPSARITVKMGRPIPEEEIPGLLRTILESAGFAAVERNGVLQVLPAGRAPTVGETQVFVHPLRHASASEMALTLAAIYGSTEAAAAAGASRQSRRSLSEQMRNPGGFGVPLTPGIPGMTTPGGGGFGTARPQLGGREGDQPGVVGGVMVGEAVVVPYTPTNSLIIRTTPRNYELLRTTIDRLDTRPAQVLIEVFVAEVTLDRNTQFGIDWTGTFGDGRGAVRSADRFRTFADTTPGGVVVRLLSLGRNVDVRATLRALSADARVNVIATPSILARNNEEARILVGSQVPFVQIARSGLAGEVLDRVVQFRDVGTELAIVPTINQDDYVTLDILQQVSTLTNQTLFQAPIITVREAQTSAVVRDRQTIVIGGLIGSEDARIRRGIPILKDIPLLGYLFRDTELRRRKTELVIFLTPYLVTSDADVDLLRERSIDRTENRRNIRRELRRRQLDAPRVRVSPAAPDSVPAARPVRPPPDSVPPPGRL